MKKELISEFSIYAVSLILVAGFWDRPVILTVCYTFISILILLKWHTRKDLIFYCVGFILGSIGDSIAVYFGAWGYSKPFYLIPLWLPFLWGIAALLIKNICGTLLKIRNKQKIE
jgi:hypothetical protein